MQPVCAVQQRAYFPPIHRLSRSPAGVVVAFHGGDQGKGMLDSTEFMNKRAQPSPHDDENKLDNVRIQASCEHGFDDALILRMAVGPAHFLPMG
jgi:hypothetical protein